MYNVDYSPAAEKYFRKLKDKNLREKFKNAIQEKISKNPYIGEAKQGDLSGIYCYDIMHNKTNYELAYRIYNENGKLIVVILAGTRENFYKELKRYIE